MNDGRLTVGTDPDAADAGRDHPSLMLDDVSALRARDPHRVADVLGGFGAQCRAAALLPMTRPAGVSRPRTVIVAAMGGSAASGDLVVACAADRLEVPVLVHRGYGLPAAATPTALVVASSYSGETAEVLSALETALARGIPTVAITTGGALGALAARRRVPCVMLPKGLMPRMALGCLFFPLLSVLADAGVPVAEESEVTEALDVTEGLAAELAPGRPTPDNEAKQLAAGLRDRLPAIYGGPVTGLVAYRWKTDLAENAKVFALAGALPEMNHNEIEAWQGDQGRRAIAVLLRDAAEAAEIARRFRVLRELIEPSAAGVVDVWARGKGIVARLLSLVCLGQWTSYYLAMLRGIDPWPIPVLDELKRRVRG